MTEENQTLIAGRDKARDSEEVDRYRRLKKLAFDAGDRDREQKLFASELKAKRFLSFNFVSLSFSLHFCLNKR